jgi:hypothetical protein
MDLKSKRNEIAFLAVDPSITKEGFTILGWSHSTH